MKEKLEEFSQILGQVLAMRISEFLARYGDLLPMFEIIYEDQLVAELFDLLVKGKDYLIVVNGKHRLVGVITYLDILSILGGRSMPETAFAGTTHTAMIRRGRISGSVLSKLKISLVHKRIPPHITCDHTVQDAYNLMETSGTSFLVVVDREDKPIGVITLHSIFRATMKQYRELLQSNGKSYYNFRLFP
ncbi:MAG: hypothetical protein DRO13_02440 [Thermoprotei archaeon]|nr:MAG: hypothetical protein DRO13_02440 [Thermoprotei archaeon]